MDCPVCKKPMIVLELHSIEIDYCSICQGIWLDSGELELLLDGASNLNEILSSIQNSSQKSKGRRSCPICRKKMTQSEYGVSCIVQVDYCTKNHGIWFDKGELLQILSNCEGKDLNVTLKLLKEMFTL